MNCPNCNNRLTEELFDNQSILHCDRCGVSFFEENGINRISVKTAEKLATEISEPIVLGTEKFCPKDKAKLQLYTAESIPRETTLLVCPLCSGILAYPDDLIKFKQAQDAKVAFLKLWGTPLSSLSAVLVISLVAVISVAALAGMVYFTGGSSVKTNAADIVKNIYATESGRYVFITFQTSNPFRSEILLEDRSNGAQESLTVSSIPKTLHTLTTTLVNQEHAYTYEIILTDENGRSIVTEKKDLTINH